MDASEEDTGKRTDEMKELKLAIINQERFYYGCTRMERG